MIKKNLPIYTLDLETDPFKHGRLPKPFSAGVYGKDFGFKSFWRKGRSKEDVVLYSVAFLDTLPAGVIYIHNGGRFDLFYYMQHLNKEMFILNNRIVTAQLGKHEVRDSFAIMPFALKKYKKDDAFCNIKEHEGKRCQLIPYAMFESGLRESHKDIILEYLKGDCVYLHELCTKFVERFGFKITIGSTALTELKKKHEFKTLSSSEDAEIRNRYYYGGRVECFEKGVIDSNVKVYDVNSMYPHVMRDYLHPIGRPTSIGKKIVKETFFVTVTGKNRGAFPVKNKQGTQFNGDYGTYSITIHEYKAAVDFGLFEPREINETINFRDFDSFGRFVDSYYSEREQSKINGDTVTNLFTKFILNSAYGKFAQNPENCFDYCITPSDEIKDGWLPAWIAEDKYVIWKRRSDMAERLRVNVATAASITGAARAVLLRALATARRPLYCDTDSIICESLGDVIINETNLGSWKLEKDGDRVAIAGRKMYAVFKENKCVKMASKGVKLTAEQIQEVATGKVVKYKHMVPSFSWDGTHNFITRNVRLT